MMHRICLVPGDGVGREVVPAAAEALRALSLELEMVEAEAGFACFEKRGTALPDETLELARGSDAVLFGATSSPSTVAAGYRSPILALRREFDLYANLRPVFSLPSGFSRPGIDLLIVRENSEGLYSGRERLEGETAIAERIITRRASQRIARVACEQALHRSKRRALGGQCNCPPNTRPRLVVVHKANVLKLSDGLFRESVLEAAREYPEIQVEEALVDAAAMRLVRSPEAFDVIVTTNLFGDILSDEASALVGGLGVAPSANLGAGTPVFEPVHGSAPDIAGKGVANPVGAMLSAALMLETLGEAGAAEKLRSAVLQTLAGGLRTPDLGGTATTGEFTRAVCEKIKH